MSALHLHPGVQLRIVRRKKGIDGRVHLARWRGLDLVRARARVRVRVSARVRVRVRDRVRVRVRVTVRVTR